ncbi:hypothetical protein [Methanofollis sp. W23]|uniref:hypothetical protein n=1 Tax=Methanofollis sp. W23 TaxID=2817849 RepID=UPI001AE3A923|nr:hypothetical protein [Methanofollis sp. W23]
MLKCIGKRVHPHAIRHARLTGLFQSNGGKQGLSEMELRLVAGGEKNSNIPEVYVYLSGVDVERKLFENAGPIDNEDNQAEKAKRSLEYRKFMKLLDSI